jgi:hypothetical protein
VTVGTGLGLALCSAVALNWGFFAQHGAAASLPRLDARRPLRSLRLLFGNGRWLLGFTAGLAGWALYVGALALAPLSLVQAVSAGGIGVLALLVQLDPAAGRLRGREWAAVGAALAGLALLAISLGGGDVSKPPSLLGTGVVLVGAAALAGTVALALPGAAPLGAAAGIFYATGDVATKAAVAAAGVLLVPIVLATHGLAFVSLQLGFQRGGALSTAGMATLLTNALPIAAGALLFHEGVPPGALGICRVTAFALVTLSAVALARA